MKILIVGPYRSPIIKRLSWHLENSGYDVVIASHNVEETTKNVISLGGLQSFFGYLNFFKIRKLVKAIKPDIVHAHVLNHYGLMCVFQGKPLVVALWGSDVMVAPHSGNYLLRTIYRCINYLVLRIADRLHTSGLHVAEEARKQFQGAERKTDTFYWGFPLETPSVDKVEEATERLANDFNLQETGYLVFSRGISDIYNPIGAAKIINSFLESGVANKIVVLKGFADSVDVKRFSCLVDMTKITFIDRLLSDEELYCLYKNTSVHFSIPHSDSLGGGVVEPALLGSYPILSNLPSYRQYVLENPGYIITEYTSENIDQIIANINNGTYCNAAKNSPSNNYALAGILDRFKETYSKALSDRL